MDDLPEEELVEDRVVLAVGLEGLQVDGFCEGDLLGEGLLGQGVEEGAEELLGVLLVVVVELGDFCDDGFAQFGGSHWGEICGGSLH